MNRRQITILLTAIAIILVSVGIYLLLNLKEEVIYPETPIIQEVSKVEQDIQIDEITNFGTQDKYLYKVSQKISLEQIKDLASQYDLSLVQSEENKYYYWSGDAGTFTYDLNFNEFTFSLKPGFESTEVSLNGQSFSNFLNKYFEKDWDFEVFEVEIMPDGETVYYAKRHLEDGNLIETRNFDGATDYLAQKEGALVYGKICLTEFYTENISVPLMEYSNLKSLINVEGYPKEVYPDYSVLKDGSFSYLSEDFLEVTETLNSCEGESISVVYLYKRFDQDNLTPVYKIISSCKVEHDGDTYSVPATIYVNAIDPEYVGTGE